MPRAPDKHNVRPEGLRRHVTVDNEWGQPKVVRKLKGRPWRRLREQILKRDGYLCQRCLSVGRLSVATEVDHIKPIQSGGDDSPGNLQSLDHDCHQIKSASEGGKASVRPEWLPKPACPVLLLTGPPGGGKTTYAKEHKGPDDVIIDLDDCFMDVCGEHGHTADRIHLTAVLRLRNSRLADLALKKSGRAYVIVSCGKLSDQEWWARKLSADVLCLDPGSEKIAARISPDRFQLALAWYDERRSYQPV